MRKLLLSHCLVLAFLVSGAQNIVHLEYFLDTDAGIGRNNTVTVSPATDGSFPLNVNLSGVAPGYHTLSFRARDENGNWSQTVRRYIEVQPNGQAPANINAEYFFNQDPGFGNGVPITFSLPDSANAISFTANVSTLSPGMNRLYIRTKDSFGRWSQTTRTVIELLPAGELKQVVAGEYFFDTDPGFGTAKQITLSASDSLINQSFVANVSGLTPGMHAMYSRFLDNHGKWGQTFRRTIDVTTAPDTNYVVSLEYFFKKDPGVGNAVPVRISTPFQNGSFTFNIPFSQLSATYDTLYMRAKDSSAVNWSFTEWRPIIIILPLEILKFNAKRQNLEALLSWETQNEVNTSVFYIERSLDGNSFATIGKIAAKGNRNTAYYNYNDNIAGLSSSKIYYRLREVDQDGRFVYSNIVSVDMPESNAAFIVTPNPASTYVDVFPGKDFVGKNASVIISDMTGRVMIRQQADQAARQRISVSLLAKGVYTVSVLVPGKMETQKLVIK